MEGLRLYSSYQDAVGIDGEAIEFEWKISQDFHHCLFLKKSNKTWRSGRSSQRSSQTGSSSCQCSMTLRGKRMMRIDRMPRRSQELRNEILAEGHWTFLGPGSEEKWYGSSDHARKVHQNGATIQRNWSSCFQKYQCLESWNLEAKKR